MRFKVFRKRASCPRNHVLGVCKDSRGTEAGQAQRSRGHLSGCAQEREGFPKPRAAPERGRGVERQQDFTPLLTHFLLCLQERSMPACRGRGARSAHWLREQTGPWAWGARISRTPDGWRECVQSSREVKGEDIPFVRK